MRSRCWCGNLSDIREGVRSIAKGIQQHATRAEAGQSALAEGGTASRAGWHITFTYGNRTWLLQRSRLILTQVICSHALSQLDRPIPPIHSA